MSLPAWRSAAGELAASAYARRLGLAAGGGLGDAAAMEQAATGGDCVGLAWTVDNTNTGGRLHGGAVASVMMAAAPLALAAGDGDGSGGQGGSASWLPAAVSLRFLEPVRSGGQLTGRARVLRRGRTLAFIEAEAVAAGGSRVGVAMITLHRVAGRATAGPSLLEKPSGPAGATWPRVGQRAPSAYTHGLGMEVETIGSHGAAVKAPLAPNEGRAGCFDEGAIVGLLDTCGAIAAYTTSIDGGRGASSTLGLDLSFITPLVGDCRAVSRALGRSGEVATGCVEASMVGRHAVAGDRNGVAVVGTITYRLQSDGELKS
ncbi:MAG TPA: hypothetical protein EYG16_09595 [Deltaproteobacteria bacterium]|nr:hypothetical protein [Candidatus Binatota bacterium]HIL13909.1 hypothetical protein [Deltaproteobacteria bacterium]